MEHEGLSKVAIEVTVSVPPYGSGQLFQGGRCCIASKSPIDFSEKLATKCYNGYDSLDPVEHEGTVSRRN